MHLLQLPTELHLEIGTYSSQCSIARLCRTSRHLHHVFTKPLYTNDNDYALLWSAEHGINKTLELAVQYGANVDTFMYPDGLTALALATWNEHAETLRILLEKGANPHIHDIYGYTPLHQAARDHLFTEGVILLLGGGAQHSARSNDGTTPLILALEHDHIDSAMVLLKSGADVELAPYNGEPPLHAACMVGKLEMVELLLNFGADVRQLGRRGLNAFDLAVRHDHIDIVAFFLENVSSVIDLANRLGGDQNVSLHFAIKSGYYEIVEALIEHGVNVSAVASDGWTPLCCASFHEEMAVAEYVLQKGADVKVANENGMTPLHALFNNGGNVEMARLFLDKGADMEAVNDNGETPMTLAVYYDYLELVRLFVDRGADASYQHTKGSSLLDLAISMDDLDIVKLLWRHRQNKSTETEGHRKAINLAKQQGRDKIVKFLEEEVVVVLPSEEASQSYDTVE